MKRRLGEIDHIGIAVTNLEEAKRIYCDSLGIPCAAEKTIPERGIKIAFLPTGNTAIELLEGIGEDSGISKFIAQRGPGIHHVCFEVDDIASVLEGLAADGIRLIDAVARPGAEGKPIAFVHPKSTMGVLIELIQK